MIAFVCFWRLKVPTQNKPLLNILLCYSLCKMANFQNDVISRILSMFFEPFFARITVIQKGVIFDSFFPQNFFYVCLGSIFCIIFDPRKSATRQVSFDDFALLYPLQNGRSPSDGLLRMTNFATFLKGAIVRILGLNLSVFYAE